MPDLAAHYLEEIRRQFRGYKRLSDGALAQLHEDELFRVIDPESNSIAIIVKHMWGNMRSRWVDFLTSDGEKPDRHRDQEFVLDPGTTKDDVMRWWEDGWRLLFAALDPLRPEDVEHSVFIRGERHTALQAINRQLAHYAYHVGQIVFLAKHLRASGWKSLSIPRGESEAFNARMAERHEKHRS